MIVDIEWDASKDLQGMFPRVTIRGDLMTHDARTAYTPTVVTTTHKTIGDNEYFGMLVYHGIGSSEFRRDSLVGEVLLRRMQTPHAGIDIVLDFAVPFMLNIVDYEEGVLKRVHNGENVKRPFLFAAGKHHLQAIGRPSRP